MDRRVKRILHIAFHLAGNISEAKKCGVLMQDYKKFFSKERQMSKYAVSDIFRTMQWGGTSDFAGQYIKAGGGWESRQLKLNLTYRFGSTQVKAARQRKTGLEDENKRVGSQGGGISN